jgi:hypothetical protein
MKHGCSEGAGNGVKLESNAEVAVHGGFIEVHFELEDQKAWQVRTVAPSLHFQRVEWEVRGGACGTEISGADNGGAGVSSGFSGVAVVTEVW